MELTRLHNTVQNTIWRHLPPKISTKIRSTKLFESYSNAIRKLFESYSKTIRKLFESCSKTIRKLFESYSKAVRKLFENYLKAVRKLFVNYSKTVRKLFENCSKAIRKLFESYSKTNLLPAPMFGVSLSSTRDSSAISFAWSSSLLVKISIKVVI